MVLQGYLKLCVYFFYREHTVVVALGVFYYPGGDCFTPGSEKDFSFMPTTIPTTSNGSNGKPLSSVI